MALSTAPQAHRASLRFVLLPPVLQGLPRPWSFLSGPDFPLRQLHCSHLEFTAESRCKIGLRLSQNDKNSPASCRNPGKCGHMHGVKLASTARYPPSAARLSVASQPGTQPCTHVRPCLQLNCRHCQSLSITFWTSFSFHTSELQNYLIRLLKNLPTYQFTLLIVSQHIT